MKSIKVNYSEEKCLYPNTFVNTYNQYLNQINDDIYYLSLKKDIEFN